MRWQRGRVSRNVEDLRGRGGFGGFGRRGAGLGCGGLLVVIVIALLTGTDPSALLRLMEGGGAPAPSDQGPAPAQPPPGDQLGRFASVVLADTEDTWHAIFAETGRQYEPPVLVIFDRAVRSGCGLGSASTGPFYCPLDSRVYIDLSFFDDLARRFGAPGDFAQAYVIAHEVGHHVQNLLGVSGATRRAQEEARSEAEANRYSVRLELQADCFAGVWAHHAHRERNLLEPGDVEEGLTAASAIGDDRLQRRSTGTVQPETWTHGSSEQRVSALRRGIQSGDPTSCDAF